MTTANNYPAAFVAWLQEQSQPSESFLAEFLPTYETAEEVSDAFRYWVRNVQLDLARNRLTAHDRIAYLRALEHPRSKLVVAYYEAEEATKAARRAEAKAWDACESAPFNNPMAAISASVDLDYARGVLILAEEAQAAAWAAIAA